MIAEPLGVELRIQLTKVFLIVVAEEAANPNIGGQKVSPVVRINFRREPSSRNEFAEGGLEGLKFKSFAKLKVDCPYPEVSEDGDGTLNHIKFPGATRHLYFNRTRHVYADDFERMRVKIYPVSMEIGHILVGEILVKTATFPAFPNDSLSEVGKPGFEVILEEEALDGSSEAVVFCVLMALVHDEFSDSTARKEDRVDLSVWKLNRFLKTASDPKNPIRVDKWIKFTERGRKVRFSVTL